MYSLTELTRLSDWNLIHIEFWIFLIVQKDATYSVYCISVGSSTCFGCWHPSSGAGTAVITASGIGQPGLLPSAFIVELQLYVFQMSTPETCRAAYRNVINWIQSHLVGRLLNLIRDARTHEYKIYTYSFTVPEHVDWRRKLNMKPTNWSCMAWNKNTVCIYGSCLL